MTEYGVLVDEEPAGTKRPVLMWVLAGLGCLVLVALVVTSFLSLQAARKASERVEALEDQVAQLSLEQGEISSQFGSLPEAFGVLADRIAQVEMEASSARSAAEVANQRADDAQFRAEDIVRCVNRYMKTVGDAGGGRYTYYFC